jgi:hypothetical protein
MKAILQAVLSILAIIAMSFGRLISMPDNVARLYGLPLNWGAHQLVTIAGPVDMWRVNITNLVLDLVFWMIILLISGIYSENLTKNNER